MACVGVTLSQSESANPYAQLARYLQHHHLSRGVGDYWTSATATVYGDGRLAVRQVTPDQDGSLEPYLYLSTSKWYAGTFQFLVYDLSQSTGVAIREASQYPFFPVAHRYRDGTFRIVVWKSPEVIRAH
jgi:hypothetical protein